jgi:hypothetical protein
MDDPGLAHHYRIALRRPKPIDSLRSQQPLDAASSPVPYQVRYPHVGRCLYPAPARLHCPRRGRKDMVHRSSPARPPARRDARGPPDPNQLKRHGPYAPVFSPPTPTFSTAATGAATPRTYVRSTPNPATVVVCCWCDATPKYPGAGRRGEARQRDPTHRVRRARAFTPSPMRGREPCRASAVQARA